MSGARRCLAALAAALLIAGCGGGRRPSPSTTRPSTASTAAAPSTTPSAAAVARAQRTHELPTPHAPQTVVGGWRTPTQAVEVFAAAYINWSAATVAAQLRSLAAVSVGQARSAMTLAASQVRQDSTLKSGGIANAGTVEAVGPQAGQAHTYVVVTRERTTATQTNAYRGLAPAWHIALATVTQLHDGLWVLSGWQPES